MSSSPGNLRGRPLRFGRSRERGQPIIEESVVGQNPRTASKHAPERLQIELLRHECCWSWKVLAGLEYHDVCRDSESCPLLLRAFVRPVCVPFPRIR